MHIQNLVEFYKRFLKIFSKNEIMTDGMTDNPNNPPLFQSWAINMPSSNGSCGKLELLSLSKYFIKKDNFTTPPNQNMFFKYLR